MNEREKKLLNGTWSYHLPTDGDPMDASGVKPGDIKTWPTVELPVNWYNTEIGDHFGVVWFARLFDAEFDVEKVDQSLRRFIRFRGVDYSCKVWLNGVYLGDHEGFFNAFEFPVKQLLKEKGNLLVVADDAPMEDTEYVYGASRATEDYQEPMSPEYMPCQPVALKCVKGAISNFWHRPGWKTRYGYEGNSGGIWNDVELYSTGVVKIENVKIDAYPVRDARKDYDFDGSALANFDLELSYTGDQTVTAQIEMTLSGENFKDEPISYRREIVLPPGHTSVHLTKTLDAPKLWWTWDHGEPNLYKMKLTISLDGTASDTVTDLFGVREFKRDDRGWWYLNGKRVFLRGMRYLSSIWLGEGNRDLFKEDLDKMRDLNINAVRIGSHVEKEQFYDLCDRMGILCWQVLPFHWGNYTDDDDLIERAAPMMEDMVRELTNHASIGIWSTYKEPLVFPFSDRKAPNLYGRLCEVLKEAGRSVDPVHWMHKGDYREGVQNVTQAGWGKKFPDYRERVRQDSPQMVEFGSMAVAPMETVNRILKPEEQWPPQWDRWFYLNLDPYWIYMMDIDLDKLGGIEELMEATQDFEWRVVKESGEYLRQRKYDPTASMFLYFWNDPYPCLGGAGVLDYYRNKYKCYDAFIPMYQPFMVSLEWIKDPFMVGYVKYYSPGDVFRANLWLTNDTDSDNRGVTVTWSIGDGTKTYGTGAIAPCDSPSDSSLIAGSMNFRLPEDAQGDWRVDVKAEGGGKELSTNFFVFSIGDRRYGFKEA